MVVELIFILLFDLNTVLKAAKAGLKGSLKMAAQGAKNTTKALLGAGRKTLVNSGRNTLKVGRGLINLGAGGTKLTVSGLKNGFSRGVKTVQDLIGRIKSNLSFKKFRIRRQGRWFKLEGKLNPWVLLASGEIREVDSVKGTDDVVRNVGETGSFGVKGSDEIVEGMLIGNADEASDLVRTLQNDEALRNAYVNKLKESLKNNAKLAEGESIFTNLKLGEPVGSGGNKNVFDIVDHSEKVVAVLKTGKPISAIEDELRLLKKLADNNLPVVKVIEKGKYQGQAALIMEKYAQGSKDVVKRTGKKMEIVGESRYLNQRSILDLNKIKRILSNNKISIDDLQFLIGKDGSVVIADPLKVFLGQKPSKWNIKMINKLIEVAGK